MSVFMARATKVEKQKRIYDVKKMLLASSTRADICEFMLKKHGVAKWTTDRYIAEANKQFSDSSIFSTDRELGLNIEQLKDLYHKSMRIDDYKSALAIRKELTKLLGLYPAEKSEVTIKDESLTDEQRLARIAEILDKARDRRDRDSS